MFTRKSLLPLVAVAAMVMLGCASPSTSGSPDADLVESRATQTVPEIEPTVGQETSSPRPTATPSPSPTAAESCPSPAENQYMKDLTAQVLIITDLRNQSAELLKKSMLGRESPLYDVKWKTKHRKNLTAIEEAAGVVSSLVAPSSIEHIHLDVLLFAKNAAEHAAISEKLINPHPALSVAELRAAQARAGNASIDYLESATHAFQRLCDTRGGHAGATSLFADASDGIQQFVGGDTIPTGDYEFRCGALGNVSVQIGSAPYTISAKEGDQTRTIKRGDTVTVGWCKVFRLP